MPPKGVTQIWRVAMNIGKALLVIGIVLTVAAGLQGCPWLVFGVEVLLNFATGALLWAGGL